MNLAQSIRFLVLDIDGVCTNGMLYYSSEGKVTKAFYAHDGIAIKTALKIGLGIGVITGRDDASVAKRVKDLGITDYYAGFEAKLPAIEKIRKKYSLEWNEMAYLGDDWIDLDPMMRVGYPMAVANARPEVKTVAKYITTVRGGDGAVREAIEHILAAQGKTGLDLASLWTVSASACHNLS